MKIIIICLLLIFSVYSKPYSAEAGEDYSDNKDSKAQGIGTDDGKKEGKKGDSESGEVIYDEEIESDIIPGEEEELTEKEVKKEGNKEGKKGDSESGEDIWGEEMTEEELKEWNKEYVGMLKKKLERFEKKSKKNGKLTQKEEEEKKGVIEMINELNAEMNELIHNDIESDIVPGEEEVLTEKEVKEEVKESLMLLKKKLERFEKKSKKNGKLTQKEEEEKKGVIEMINELNAEMNELNAAWWNMTQKELKGKKERLRLMKKKLEKLEKKSKKKKGGKKGDSESGEVREDDIKSSDIETKIVPGSDEDGGKKKSKKDGKTTQEEEEKKGANHPVLSGEPLECGQVPPMRKRSPGAICRKIGFHIWGFVDGKCQEFIRGSCGTKIPGFASKDECQRACGPKKIELKKGQDYKCPTGNPYDCKL